MLIAALKGQCPQCGAATLFDGVAKFAPKCPACGLDFSAYNVGDGPAAFLTMGVGAIIVFLAITVDQGLHPPFWVHVLLWVPLTAVMTALSLRVAKAMLLTIEHRRGAREASSKQDDTP